MTWRIAERLFHKDDNLCFETVSSFTDLAGDYPNWSGDSGEIRREPQVGGANVPWMGTACAILYATGANWTANYAVSSAYWPRFHDDGEHSLRASVRFLARGATTTGVGPIIVASAAAAPLDTPVPRWDFGGPYHYRLQNSWQHLYSDLATWSGASAVNIYLGGNSTNDDSAYDDLRLYADEIEIPENIDQRVDEVSARKQARSLGGKAYVYRLGFRRRWRIPAEVLPDSAWPRIERWHANDAKLWIIDPSCNSYPAVFTARRSPIGQIYPGRYDLRRGTIEIEADYRYPITGHVAGEPLP